MTLQWCFPPDLSKYGTTASAIAEVPLTDQTAACISATATMAGYFRGRFPVDDPSFAILDTATVMYTAWIATYLVLTNRGYDPAAGSDLQIKERYDAAIAWGLSVQKGAYTPLVSFAAPPGKSYQLPAVYTKRLRGWS